MTEEPEPFGEVRLRSLLENLSFLDPTRPSGEDVLINPEDVGAVLDEPFDTISRVKPKTCDRFSFFDRKK